MDNPFQASGVSFFSLWSRISYMDSKTYCTLYVLFLFDLCQIAPMETDHHVTSQHLDQRHVTLRDTNAVTVVLPYWDLVPLHFRQVRLFHIYSIIIYSTHVSHVLVELNKSMFCISHFHQIFKSPPGYILSCNNSFTYIILLF